MDQSLRRHRLRLSSGNAAMIFALAGGTLALIAASAIELGRISDMRTKLAAASDAAALAAKRQQIERFGEDGLAASRSAGEQAGRDLFDGNRTELAGLADNVNLSIGWDPDGSARVTATADARLLFGGILSLGGALPLSSVPLQVVSVAGSGTNSWVEIAMVLDNTGSMFSTDGRPTTRFTNLRAAAIAFTNTAFDAMSVPDRLRIAVVPWAATVNIRGEQPLGWDPAPVAGGTTVVADRGTRTLPASPLNRNGEITQNSPTLAALFAPVTWRGCISGDGESLTASDGLKSPMRWDALAVPSNMHQTTWRPQVTSMGTCWNCPSPPASPPTSPPTLPPPPPPPPGGPIGSLEPGRGPWPAGIPHVPALTRTPVSQVQAGCTAYACPQTQCDPGHPGVSGTLCWQAPLKGYGAGSHALGRRNTYAPTDGTCIDTAAGECTAGAAPPTRAQPACVSDPNEFAWNSAGGAVCSDTPLSAWTSFDPTVGPNINCPMPMLGLSGSRAQVLGAINRMSPVVGGTHADVGLRWGLRALSPRAQWANFFGNPGAARPQAFGRADAKKAMILITDGENTEAEDFPGFWGCSDTTLPGCSGAPDQAELDARMDAWCSAIRNDYEVELYTVAVNISNPAAVARLASCAGDPSRAFAVDASQLDETLGEVAQSIFQLHIKE